MKRIAIAIIGLLFITGCGRSTRISGFDHVDPNIGSVHGRWFFYTPASLPFGMAKLAPHTNGYGSKGGWIPCGYDNRHSSIEGFGFFHEFQVGGVVLMPTTGDIKTLPGSLENPDEGYRSRFDKKDEHAEPGYYSVLLKDYSVKAELTATERVGYNRYTYPQGKSANLIFDIGHRQGESGEVTNSKVELVNGNEIQGYVETYPGYVKFCQPERHVRMYFVARLSETPKKYGTFIDGDKFPGKARVTGIGAGMFVSFGKQLDSPLEVRVGLSYTSLDNARNNLKKEGVKGFDQTRKNSKEIWSQMLDRIQVEGGSATDTRKFYTGLYHALLGRGISSDANGDYPRVDGTTGHTPKDEQGNSLYNHYNTDGIWGAFWNLTQLWSVAYPEHLSEYIKSNLDYYRETGWLHDGIAAGAYANGVPSNFNGLVIAGAYQCGIRDFDIATAYEAARKNELIFHGRPFGVGKYDLRHFVNKGYIPLGDTTISNGWIFNFGTSHTLEYAFSSWAVGNMAKSLGHNDDYKQLNKLGAAWKNIFDGETKYIRPREADGSFLKDFNPMEAWKGFQEGNGFQYSWYVPHDPKGLADLMGKKLFNERLENMFTQAQKSVFGGGKEIDSFSGLEKLYNHGNQPCLHDAWLFNYSGKPWLTQKWTRTICNEFYGDTPLHGYGFGQDEDQGQLGAWYVMASMGLFDVQGGAALNPQFQIGSPIFDRVTISLNPRYYKGKQLVIETINNAPDNYYVRTAKFNGNAVNDYSVDRKLLMEGGVLQLEMTPDAQK